MMKNKKEHFLREVNSQIRSREAKKFVTSELEYHINEVKKEWVDKGFNEAEAEEKAISQMGSPAKLGQELNKLHKPRIDWWLISLLAVTMALSFLPLMTLNEEMFTEKLMLKKALHVMIGLVLAVIMMFVDYRRFEKRGWIFYSIGILLLLTLLNFPNRMVNGVPYIMLGPFQIQSLMALPFFFLAWASFFNSTKIKLWLHMTLFALPLLLLMAVPNLPAVMIYIVMVFTMMWWSRISRKTAIKVTITAIAGGVIFSTLAWFTVKEYQLARILAFLDPEKYPQSYGYTYMQLKERLSSAGWFGSAAESQALPFEHTDYAFVNITYHYGYWLAIALFVILSMFAARITVISNQINNRYGNLLLIGSMALFLIQFIYNVAMVLRLLPLTSISMPFISYGLMPMIFNAFIMGIVLSVYRRKDLTLNRAS